VPDKTAFATKPALARAMTGRALAAGVPFAWVAADSVYGVGEFELALRRAGKSYVLGIASNHSVKSWGKAKPVNGTAASIAQGLAPGEWLRLSAGDGTKGPRLYDWAYVELADLDASG
jgi:SRSO17 transposase